VDGIGIAVADKSVLLLLDARSRQASGGAELLPDCRSSLLGMTPIRQQGHQGGGRGGGPEFSDQVRNLVYLHAQAGDHRDRAESQRLGQNFAISKTARSFPAAPFPCEAPRLQWQVCFRLAGQRQHSAANLRFDGPERVSAAG